MKWKDIIIGSIATLVVTILSGVAVYYFTKEPSKVQSEKLVYSVEQSGSFETASTKVALANVRVANIGNTAAKNVSINIHTRGETNITDSSVSISSGDQHSVKVEERTTDFVRLTVATLIPSEAVTVTLLFNSKPRELPEVQVKSDLTLGTLASTFSSSKPEEKSMLNKSLTFLLPILTVIQASLVAVYVRRRRGMFRLTSRNNTAWYLLHKGLNSQAEKILEKAMDNGEDSEFVFANYAVCLALKGEFEAANIYLEASLEDATSKHALAVTSFNKALVSFMQKDEVRGIQYLKEALKLSGSNIRRYCAYSSIFKQATEGSPKVKAILEAK
jgi:hypothetical protein